MTGSKAKRLSRKDEASLTRLAQGGDLRAMDMLVERNVPLVYHIAKRFKGPMPLEDRIQEGVMGLIRAAERFNPDRGVRFGTYASWWIRQSISRAIADQSREIRIPVHVHLRLRSIEKYAEHLNYKLGRVPTLEELAKEVKIPKKKLCLYVGMSKTPIPLSLLRGECETLIHDPKRDGGSTAETPNPEEAAIDGGLRGDVARSLEGLKSRERYIVGRHYGLFGTDPVTLSKIARELGLSRERVRQIVKQALLKLRKSDHAQGLKEFY